MWTAPLLRTVLPRESPKGSRVLLVKGKLDGEAEFAGVGFTRQQYKLLRSKRPALRQLLG